MPGELLFIGALVIVLAAAFVAAAVSSRCRNWLKSNSGATGNLAQIASALIALIGFSVVIIQLSDSRRKAAEESCRAELGDARRLYGTYSSAALQYPNFTKPDYPQLLKSPLEYERYKSFVSHMLYAYDDVLNVTRECGAEHDLNEWLVSFKFDAREHLRYLCHLNGDFWQQFRPTLKADFDSIAGDCPQQPPL